MGFGLAMKKTSFVVDDVSVIGPESLVAQKGIIPLRAPSKHMGGGGGKKNITGCKSQLKIWVCKERCQ